VVVQRMSQHLNYRISDIIRCVINNTPNSVTATYHYLRHKLLRFKAERGLFQKISAEVSARRAVSLRHHKPLNLLS
jgi:hypothetical protein